MMPWLDDDLMTVPEEMTAREWIEDLKRSIKGRTLENLSALASDNDPFLQGTDGHQERARWFKAIWRDFGYRSGVHLRRVHYQLVSQREPKLWDGTPYQNDLRCWGALTRAAASARWLGLVSFDSFVDRKNPPVKSFFDKGHFCEISVDSGDTYSLDLPEELPELPEISVGYAFDKAPLTHQVEIWAEKSTMNDILEPIAKRYRCNLVTATGEQSITNCHLLTQRLAGLPVRIFYISDFDPKGDDMPVSVARKLEWFLRTGAIDPDTDIQVIPLALTHEQVVEFDLPPVPVKDTDNCAETFLKRYGVKGATELDALEALYPGKLREILTEQIERYFDTDYSYQLSRDRTLNVEVAEAITTTVHMYGFRDRIEALGEEYEAIREIVTEFREKYDGLASEISDALAEELPEPETLAPDEEHEPGTVAWHDPREAEEHDDPLLDTTRDYIEQIDRYKARQKKPTQRRKRGTGRHALKKAAGLM